MERRRNGHVGSRRSGCRKPLWWKEYKFDPETRNNIQKGEKTFDTVGFNQEQHDFYKKLIRIRKENPVLSNGNIEFSGNKGKNARIQTI